MMASLGILGEVDRADRGVGMPDVVQHSVESPAELHGFGRRVREGTLIDRVPGVVAEQPGFSLALFFDCGRGELQLGKVSNQQQQQLNDL
jgi:hypothetical protein